MLAPVLARHCVRWGQASAMRRDVQRDAAVGRGRAARCGWCGLGRGVDAVRGEREVVGRRSEMRERSRCGNPSQLAGRASGPPPPAAGAHRGSRPPMPPRGAPLEPARRRRPREPAAAPARRRRVAHHSSLPAATARRRLPLPAPLSAGHRPPHPAPCG
ncbi:hypothetical protein DAI22_09g002550 [Oryza sativa Japonica Group]|nr:hypothetical protein DAI22_09g002550 [Oryza sativa Japonica Group]